MLACPAFSSHGHGSARDPQHEVTFTMMTRSQTRVHFPDRNVVRRGRPHVHQHVESAEKFRGAVHQRGGFGSFVKSARRFGATTLFFRPGFQFAAPVSLETIVDRYVRTGGEQMFHMLYPSPCRAGDERAFSV